MIRNMVAATVMAAAPGLPALAATSPLPEPLRAGSNLDKLVPLIDPVLELRNAHTGEHEKIRFFGATGYNHSGIKRINYFMRDWRQKEVVQCDVRLYWALAAIRSAAMKDGLDGLININSGYRSLKTNNYLRSKGYGAAKNSMHLQARAVDFTVEGGNVAHTARYAKWLQVGGVGHYPGRFTHIDSGRIRTWNG